MRQWIKECERSHPDCGIEPTVTTPLPDRVIDVQSLRLHQSFEGEVGEYAALTYCWGCDKVPGALVEANLQALMQGIPVELFPQTIKDAVSITLRLGLKYLWIDAYCIIQDSVKDKEKELAHMAEIYSHAYVTLSASTAANVHEGFLHERQPRTRSDIWPFKYPRLTVPFHLPNAEEVAGTVILQEGDGEITFSKDPIMYRSWTFQERLLSRRIIVFGAHELYWQCNGAQRQCGAFDGTGEYSRPLFLSHKMHFEARDLALDWERVIREYSRRDVTHEEDRLVALAGIASRFAETQGNKDVYLAGLWRSRIREELLWTPSQLSSEPSLPSVYVAPSWSWASVKTPEGIKWALDQEGEHDDRFGQGHTYVEIIECETTVKTSELPFGEVTSGRIRLRGQLRQVLQPQSTLCRENERKALTATTSSTSTPKIVEGGESEMDMHSSPVRLNGKVFRDTWDDELDPSSTFLLRFKDKLGLALSRDHAGLFRRIGLYRAGSKETADDDFASSDLTEIEIV